jgi:hypothetical protein
MMPAPDNSGSAGDFYDRWACRAAIPLGLLAFWGGVLAAAWQYPAEYDWRYMTLTTLLSASHDPAGHLWASAGIALGSLCVLCWAEALARRWTGEIPGGRAGAIRLLQFGGICMAGSAVLPQWLLPVRKGHEILVALAFACLCLGMVLLLFRVVEQVSRRRMSGAARRPRLRAAVLGGAAVLPMLLAGCAQAYVYYARPELHWVNLSWRAQGVPYYLSFAFWEWVTCAVLSACVAILSLTARSLQPRGRHAAANGAVAVQR